MLPSIPLGDTLSALSGVIGALVACYHNKVNGGGGQHVDVSFYEPVLTLMQPTIIAYDPAGDEPPPMRTGSRIPTGVPRNVYRTGDDRWLVLSGTTDRQVARILKIIGADTPGGSGQVRAQRRSHRATRMNSTRSSPVDRRRIHSTRCSR